MMNKATVPKKIPISFHVITFLSIVASGSESPTTYIMNDIAVPKCYPFLHKCLDERDDAGSV